MSVLDNIRFIFLYIDKYSMGKEWYFPEAVIPYNMFRYICKGSAEFFIDGEKVENTLLQAFQNHLFLRTGRLIVCMRLCRV